MPVRKSKIKQLIKLLRKRRIPGMMRNRYFLSTVVFLLWIGIFDSNNLYTQISLRYQIWKLNQKIAYYNEQLVEIKKQRDAIFGTQESMEKYAREQYKMKRDDEDLFIIVRKDPE
jgi:cell division protein FtsB